MGYWLETIKEHGRTSCSDEHPINADPTGSHGCERCTALALENDFYKGMIAALGCLWMGFGIGPGQPEYDEILNSGGPEKILALAAMMDPEDIKNSGLAPLLNGETP